MGFERSPRSRKRRRLARQREEARWAARSGPVTTRWEAGRVRDVSKVTVEVAKNELGAGDEVLAEAEVTAATATVSFRDSAGRDHSRTWHFIGSVDDVKFKVSDKDAEVEDEDPNVAGVSKGWGPRPLLPDTSHASAELKPDPYVQQKAGVADEGAKSSAEVKKDEKKAEKAAVASDSSAKADSAKGASAKKA